MSPSNRFTGTIPKGLVRAIKSNKCILFLGAGISRQAEFPGGYTLPDWVSLLQMLANWAENMGCITISELDQILRLISNDKFLIAGEILNEALGDVMLAEGLRHVLKTGQTPVKCKTHDLIVKFPWRAIFTSNYDTLIEDKYAPSPRKYVHANIDEADQCLYERELFIFKLHGCVGISGSPVLGQQDYSKLLYLSPKYSGFMERIFHGYTILFMGYGGADPDLDHTLLKLSSLSRGSNKKHYFLISKNAIEQIELDILSKTKALHCICYENISGDHSQVPAFLRSLLEECRSV